MTSTARDIRYGRRGGRWADPPSTTPGKPRPGINAAQCRHCGRSFRHDQKTRPVSCGRLVCHAKATWTAPEWAAAARFATIRQTLGLPLNTLDHTALPPVRSHS